MSENLVLVNGSYLVEEKRANGTVATSKCLALRMRDKKERIMCLKKLQDEYQPNELPRGYLRT